MKKKILIFLGIFIFIMIPKNVFAKEVYPFSIKMNNTNFTNSSTSYNSRLSPTISLNGGTYTLTVSVESYDYDALNLDYSFRTYPYTLIFFQTWSPIDEMGVSKSTACTQSCFGRDSISLMPIGKDAETSRFRYVLIVENKKWLTDCGVGSGQCIYHIDDQFTFTNKSTSTDRAWVFYQVLLTDDISVFNNNKVDVDAMISNANSNRQQIVNALTSVKTDINSVLNAIKGNDTTNTNNIINNQNTNQQQTNQKLDNIDNTMKNDSIDTSQSNSFFSSFSTTDNGGISSILTAPLVAINKMLDNNCTALSVNYRGKEISLPCGTQFWNEMPTIKSFLTTIESGILAYFIIKKLFELIHNLKDPDNDKVEVMNL